MHLLSEFDERIKLLNRYGNFEILELLEEKILTALKTNDVPYPVGQAIKKTLFLDIAYLLFRHHQWCHAPFFTELTIDYLNSEFKLPRNLATNLVESCFDVFLPYVPSDGTMSLETYNREFLIDLFIASATAANESQLRRDLGFGDHVIQILKTAAQLMHEPEENLFCFAPEVTQKIFDIMQEIAHETQNHPWIMDLYKLRLLLHQGPIQHKKQLTWNQLQLLFRILSLISHQGIKKSELMKSYESADQSEGEPLRLDTGLRILEQNQLIYSQLYRHEEIIRLSDSAMELLKNYFCQDIINQNQNYLNDLSTYPESIQKCLLETAFTPDEQGLRWFLHQVNNLSPSAVAIIAMKFAETAYVKEVVAVLEKLLHNSQNPWARARICKILVGYYDTQMVLPVLEGIAKSDASPMVRKIARKGQTQMISRMDSTHS